MNIPQKTLESKIAIVLADTNTDRSTHLLALELDERLVARGFQCRIFDMADKSYPTAHLNQYGQIIIIGIHNGSLYSTETHELLSTHRQVWRGKKIASVINASENIQAKSADVLLRSALKSLGVGEISESLIVLESGKRFDSFLNIMDIDLSSVIDRFLDSFVNIRARTNSFAISA